MDYAPLALIETLRWTPDDGFYLEDLHIQRLEQSACDLGFYVEPVYGLRGIWREHIEGCTTAQKVRCLYHKYGRADVSVTPIEETQGHWRGVVSEHRLNSLDPMLRHKTTQRTLYNVERARIRGMADEVIFLNERDQVCEGAITNIFVQRDDENDDDGDGDGDATLLTPPVSCGLLPGTLRTHLLQTNQAREAILTLDDLYDNNVFVGNAVRGLVPMTLLR